MDYHEPVDELQKQARDIARALNSLKEEVEATDWYHQRVATSEDESLKAILVHNRDEEIEHACMLLEWLRRNMPTWDEELRTYLFTDLPITEVEEAAEGSSEDSPKGNISGGKSLNIGNLK